MIFTEKQLEVIAILSDGILPEDSQTPSATQIGINHIFVDIASSWTDEAFFGTAGALDAVYELVLSVFSKEISILNDEEVQVLVNIIANSDVFNQFWEPFRLLVTLSYYALPPGFLPIGLPGPSVDMGGLTVEGFPV